MRRYSQVFVMTVGLLLSACSSQKSNPLQVAIPSEDTQPRTLSDAEELAAPSQDLAPPIQGDYRDSCGDLVAYERYVERYEAGVDAAGSTGGLLALASLQADADNLARSLNKLEVGTPCYQRFIKAQTRFSQAVLKASGASQKDRQEIQALHQQVEKANEQFGCLSRCQSISDPMRQLDCLQGCH